MDIIRLINDINYCDHLLSILKNTINQSNIDDDFDDETPKFIYDINIYKRSDSDSESHIQIEYYEDDDDRMLLAINDQQKERLKFLEQKLNSGEWTTFILTYSFSIMGKLRIGTMTCMINPDDPSMYEFTFSPQVEDNDFTLFSPLTVDESDYFDFIEELNALVHQHFSYMMLISINDVDDEMSKYVLENS